MNSATVLKASSLLVMEAVSKNMKLDCTFLQQLITSLIAESILTFPLFCFLNLSVCLYLIHYLGKNSGKIRVPEGPLK